MGTLTWLLPAAIVGALCSCKYNKETVPIRRAPTEIRVPNQQRVVALATDQAVEALDFTPLAGKTVSIELTGIFPHSYDDMLHYVQSQVEAKAARAGARVITQQPVLVLPGTEQASSVAPPPAAQGSLALSDPPDYRLLINVSWGGADVRDKVTTDEPLLTKQIGLGVGGLISGVLLYEISDSSFRKTFATMGTIVTVGSSVGWFMKKSPFPHVKTLIGRARIVAQGVPTKEGKAFTTEGAGESKIVNDERVPEGYMVVQ